MALPFQVLEPVAQTPRVMVVGVGGAGGNAVDTMILRGLDGVECVAANSDAQALAKCAAPKKIQLGPNVTRGLGAGADPELGAQAARESEDEIRAILEGAQMVFVAAGMGGGTGTGGAPVVAAIAREMGLLTVGVATKPFSFEGARRMRSAEVGVAQLQECVDTLIVIPNQNLFSIADAGTSFADAFSLADQVLYEGVKGVTDLMMRPGLMNLDFADVRAVMSNTGDAMMGAGEAAGDGRAMAAAEQALANPLLDGVTVDGARGVLINITGGMDLTLFEVNDVANRVREAAHEDANIIFGSTLDPDLDGRVRVTVVATGVGAEAAALSPDTAHAAEPTLVEPAAAVVNDPSPEAMQTAERAAAEAVAEQPAQPSESAVSAEPTPVERAPAASEPRGGFAAERRDVLVRKLAGGLLDEAAAESVAATDGARTEQARRSEGPRVEIPSFLRRHAT